MKRTFYIIGGFTLAFLMPFNSGTEYSKPKDTTMKPHGRRGTGI